MALLLQGRGYNLRRGGYTSGMGVHPHAAMKGVQSPCPLLVPVFREAYDRTKPTEEGRASALRGPGCRAWTQRSSTRARPKSRLRPAPPGAAAEASLRALLLVARDEDWTRKKLRALRQRRCQRTPRLRLGASLLPWVTTLSTVDRSTHGVNSS